MFQPTNSTKKDNNLGLPPEPPSLEELADAQEPPGMGAGRDIVPNFLVLAADEVSAAPVQAEASTGLPVLAADEVRTPVQAGVGTEFILEERAGFSYDQLPVLAADEVSVLNPAHKRARTTRASTQHHTNQSIQNHPTTTSNSPSYSTSSIRQQPY
jgi:hypothetical protein